MRQASRKATAPSTTHENVLSNILDIPSSRPETPAGSAAICVKVTLERTHSQTNMQRGEQQQFRSTVAAAVICACIRQYGTVQDLSVARRTRAVLYLVVQLRRLSIHVRMEN